MKRESIELELESAGWERTIGAPSEVVDYQRRTPYNRVILYSDDLSSITTEHLQRLMKETDLSKHGLIIAEAKAALFGEPVEIKPETKVPEGVTMVKFEFLAEVDAKVAEDMFEVMIAKGAEFRSAVNMGTMVRAVMYPKGSKTGSPIRMVTKDKDTAWSLQQTIDWQYRDIINVVAVKKEGLIIEVAYIKRGLKVPPPKEKMIYAFKKTDGWTLKGEER